MHKKEDSGHGKGMIFQISFLYPEFDLHGLTATLKDNKKIKSKNKN